MPPNPNQTVGYALDFHGMTKGVAFVNGHNIGRYWNITVPLFLPSLSFYYHYV